MPHAPNAGNDATDDDRPRLKHFCNVFFVTRNRGLFCNTRYSGTKFSDRLVQRFRHLKKSLADMVL